MSASTALYAEKSWTPNGSQQPDRLRSSSKLWLREYNHTRPHQALGMRPPVPETLLENGP
ncbi:integrase core domain-containing protein [Tropicimonas sp. TH_r6]|uniref:integrase core domain-containing protein n=1 Tax=Tropicimonas sp. TH_r6 TaxID=3082085 RepID=UPI0039878827